MAAAFVFLMSLDAGLSWILLFIMPVALLASKGYVKKMRRLTKAIRSSDSRVQEIMQENLQHRTLINALERTPDITNELAEEQSNLQRQFMSRTDFSLFSRTAVQLGFAAGYATAFLWGVFGLKDGSVTFGVMTAFLQLVSQIQRPVLGLGQLIPSFVHSVTSAERLAEMSDLPSEEKGRSVVMEGRLGIRFDSVTFSYPDGSGPVISDFSYDFRPGSSTAVLGETGSGKSTLVRLILALLLPDKGRISIYSSDDVCPSAADSLRSPDSPSSSGSVSGSGSPSPSGSGAAEEATISPLTRCNIVYIPQGNTADIRIGQRHRKTAARTACKPESRQNYDSCDSSGKDRGFVQDLADIRLRLGFGRRCTFFC